MESRLYFVVVTVARSTYVLRGVLQNCSGIIAWCYCMVTGLFSGWCAFQPCHISPTFPQSWDCFAVCCSTWGDKAQAVLPLLPYSYPSSLSNILEQSCSVLGDCQTSERVRCLPSYGRCAYERDFYGYSLLQSSTQNEVTKG